MATTHSLTRRSAIAGLGAGSLGLLFGASATAAPPAFETGGSGSTEALSTASHRLAGRWLSTLGLPSRPDVAVTVPSFFGADGTVVMIFPGMEAEKRGIQVRGVALGDWEPTSFDTGHFTAVQVLANLEGSYIGTVTIDGYAKLDADGIGFSVRNEDHLFVVRDQMNAIVERLAASATHPMRGFRMRVGNAGFPEQADPLIRPNDPRSPD